MTCAGGHGPILASQRPCSRGAGALPAGRRQGRATTIAVAVAWLALVALSERQAAHAQPESSFRVACGELRERIAALEPDDATLVMFQVVGRVALVRSTDAVTYLAVCGPPDPVVICVAYRANETKVGDEVVVSGGYDPDSTADRVVLDPCLQFPAGETE